MKMIFPLLWVLLHTDVYNTTSGRISLRHINYMVLKEKLDKRERWKEEEEEGQ